MTCVSVAISFANLVFAEYRPLIVGIAVGEMSGVKGPASMQVDMRGCQFFMKIAHGEYVKYNDPDLIFYRSRRTMKGRDLPHLKQAEMPSGYDWWFNEPKNAKNPWAGLMCESISNFKWSLNPGREEISPELQDIMDSNSLRCPADFDGEKWVKRRGSARFTNFNVVGGVGFMIDRKLKNGEAGSRFCFVHGEYVLIGVSGGEVGGGDEGRESGGSIINFLKNIEFKSDDVPAKQ